MPNILTKNDLLKSFLGVGIDASEREIAEMIEFMKSNPQFTIGKSDDTVLREEFRSFFI